MNKFAFIDGLNLKLADALQVAIHIGDEQSAREFRRRIRNAK